MSHSLRLLRGAVCALVASLPTLAQEGTIVPMQADITVPATSAVTVHCSFLAPVEVNAMCIYGTEPAGPATLGGEGGCINLPGGIVGQPALDWWLHLVVPNAPSLHGVTFLVLGVQVSPLVVGGDYATVTVL